MAESKLQQRVARMAQSDPERGRVLEFLREQQAALEVAADAGAVPATAVSQLLIDKFTREALVTPTMRQFCGMAISSILAMRGFEIAQTGVRTWKDPLFSFGTTFQRKHPTRYDGSNSIIARFIDCLTESELLEARDAIDGKLTSISVSE